MNAFPSHVSLRNGKRHGPVALAMVIPFLTPLASAAVVNLGVASGFAVLAGSGITNTGTTTINGDVGSAPTPAITGFETVTLNGVNHGGDAVTVAAKANLSSAYDSLTGMASTSTLAGAYDLGGDILAPGVYTAPVSLWINGTVTLNALGNPDAFWVFQIGSTLITGTDSMVTLTGGAKAENVFWQVGSSATLGTGSDFAGTIVALQSITSNTGATTLGRLLALNGAVTLDGNRITAVPETGSALLLGIGWGGLLLRRRRACPAV